MEISDDPGAERVERRDDVRTRNDAIAASARSHHFQEEAMVPLICECDSDSCGELVRITLRDYSHARGQGTYVAAPGHRFAGVAVAAVGSDYVLYRPTP